MNEEYLTIKEFSELAGISQQAVYKRLQTKLKNYVKIVDNKKMLNKRALEDVFGKKVEQPNNNQVEDLLNLMKEQIRAKDEQIKSLQSTLELSQQNVAREQALRLKSEEKILELETKLVSQEEPSSKSIFNFFKKGK